MKLYNRYEEKGGEEEWSCELVIAVREFIVAVTRRTKMNILNRYLVAATKVTKMENKLNHWFGKLESYK
jgi:hypothetical protein